MCIQSLGQEDSLEKEMATHSRILAWEILCPRDFPLWERLVSQRVQFSSVALCDPINCSMPGLPVHHQLPEFTQTLVHRVGDAIQPSHPLSSPSPPALNLSQHQGLFK